MALWPFHGSSTVINQTTGWWFFHPLLEKAMACYSSTLAWKIPWTEEPGGLQSMGSLGVGHDWATSLSLFTFMHWRRKWQPTPVFLPRESQGWGSLVGCRLWGSLVGCRQSRTWLKRLSSQRLCEINMISLSLCCNCRIVQGEHVWLSFFKD